MAANAADLVAVEATASARDASGGDAHFLHRRDSYMVHVVIIRIL
ncbi:MAG: hypothetical protein CM15mP120_25030 [Pseudomonadota bacterium]|nr:MAG: hypothetical protein CM15mP120_25030 [Pseudomonadota bacterium]